MVKRLDFVIFKTKKIYDGTISEPGIVNINKKQSWTC